MGDVKLGQLYGGVLGLPLTYLIDRKGRIRARFQGETSLKTIETQVKRLIAATLSLFLRAAEAALGPARRGFN